MLLCVAHTLHTCNSSSHKTRSPHLSSLLLFIVLDVGSHSSSTIQRGRRRIRQSFSSIPKEKTESFWSKFIQMPNAPSSLHLLSLLLLHVSQGNRRLTMSRDHSPPSGLGMRPLTCCIRGKWPCFLWPQMTPVALLGHVCVVVGTALLYTQHGRHSTCKYARVCVCACVCVDGRGELMNVETFSPCTWLGKLTLCSP